MSVLLEPVARYWACPSCDVRDVTHKTVPESRLHPCAGMNGMTVPMVQVVHPDDAPDARHRINYREDDAYGENPIASVNTDHGDGSSDCTVYVESARVVGLNPN